MLSEGTIIALSTPQGSGALGVIRISGSLAFEKTALFFVPKSNKKVVFTPKKAQLGEFRVGDEILDEVVLTSYVAPHSYTGEDCVELSCHGSPFILQQIIANYLKVGLLPAQPGEFTLRAYLNQKMDLSQSESVADIIASESEASHRVAIQQLRGGYSAEMENLRQDLIEFKALIELELDFSEEDVAFADLDKLRDLLTTVYQKIESLQQSFSYGNAIKKGVPVAIAGKPNVGKSSLLNALLDEEKAIVSNIPGTTRDAIEDVVVIEGIGFRLIDTAGLRETEDVVEAIGIQKTREKVNQAAVLLYLYTSPCAIEEIVAEINSLYRPGLLLFLIENKIDLYQFQQNTELSGAIQKSIMSSFQPKLGGISTLDKDSIDNLKKELAASIKSMKGDASAIITNSRHFYALKEAAQSVKTVQEGLERKIPGDLLSIELKEAIFHIGTITGKIDLDEDILGTIFGRFCIGK
ncbi:MAG: tRNA uridine-5-carboxymethylaminomethyl(34) synthesis GTPase MnmE [Flavobacteriaceae bacterium]